ncbi:MAG: hypothetical protein R6X05_15770 [Desulfobacterales bacterium]
MPKRRFSPIALEDLHTYSLKDRPSKVSTADFAASWQAGGGFRAFIESLPRVLAAEDLRVVTSAVAEAYRGGRTVLAGMGAHVIKVGLNPVVVDLMTRGILNGIALNGAGIIHDYELALVGRTSEDVAAGLGAGAFGMARETCEFLGAAIRRAEREDIGLGEAVGRQILDARLPFAGDSILAAGARLEIPVTVHVAIGTDIIHMHPQFDPRAAGAASHRDFRTFAAMVASLQGGVYFNIGSAVILPEIFLKALSLVRNRGFLVSDLTTVNLDFIRQYRPLTNVVNRPTLGGGRGINLVGHHEIMLPLIAAAILEQLAGTD